MSARAPRILIVNPFGIGDVLFSTPLIRAVRHAFPNATIAYLCNRRTQEILCRNPHVDELFVYEKDEVAALWKRNPLSGMSAVLSLLRTVRRRYFDLAIDLSLGERYSFLLAILRVPRRVGFNFHRRGRFLTHPLHIQGYHDQHVVEYYAQLLASMGIRLLERDFELTPDPAELAALERRFGALVSQGSGCLVGLVPAGGISWGGDAHFRRWSKEGFIRVGRALGERYGARVVVFGEANDHPICAEIAQAIGEAAVDVSGETSLAEFVGLVGWCQLVIANDGGPIHIAASQGIKTVSIFGPVDSRVYGPYPTYPGQHWIVGREDLPCRPCYHQFKLPPCPYERACLTGVTPEEVLEACDAALASRPQTSAHATQT